MLKRVGLHVRIAENATKLIKKALHLEVPFFQCFLSNRKTGQRLISDDYDMQSFLSLRRIYFDDLYVHASYINNVADCNRTYHPCLISEIQLAKRLEFTHMILHSGTIRSHEDKKKGIDAVARSLNYVLRREHAIQFLLENTAYGNLAIGSNIEDFYDVMTKVDQPERVGFCIDTAHAHAAGYDIVSPSGYEQFVGLLEKKVGLNRIKLIHLNETRELCGSNLDVHCCIGDKQGLLGETTLGRFIHDKRFATIPILIELPVISEEDERRILQKVNSWLLHKT